MKSLNRLPLLGLFSLTALAFSASSNAAVIDFTNSAWNGANLVNSVTVGGTTLQANAGDVLTFNSSGSETAGCSAAGQAFLACAGDGIGVGRSDDEITQSSNDSITITFSSMMKVNSIYLLDLFSNESGGEQAVIDGNTFSSSAGNNGSLGGFWAIDYSTFSLGGVNQIVLTGFNDNYSDYALAALDVSAVPLPAAAYLFGSGLLGLFGVRRRAAKKAA